MEHQTLEDRLIATRGRPAGFDYLRIGLATAVILFHSFDLTAGHNVAFRAMHGIFRPLDALVLPMFFSLSGFLVAGSLERSRTLISFLGLRVIRLGPALLVETVLSAIVIGLLFTGLSYGQYFSSPVFSHYFLNILGDIHYQLPGVFTQNPFAGIVNGQLWTIPWEMKCYLAIAVIAIIGVARNRTAFAVLVVLLNVGLVFHHSFFGGQHVPHTVLERGVNGITLVQAFLYGIALYLFRTRVVWSMWACLIAALAMLILSSLPLAFWGDYLTPALVAYMTVYVGMLEPPRSRLISSGDYSYGVYLYGFPVQQAVIATLGAGGLHWFINFPISLALAGLLAVASWHVVEKQAARARPMLFRGETAILARYGAMKARWRMAGRVEPGVEDCSLDAGEQEVARRTS